MANSRRKCPHCKESQKAEAMFIMGTQAFCNKEHYIEYQVNNRTKLANKGRKIKRKETKAKKDALKTRTQHYNELQTLVNRYVRLRDKNEPCCTCGTTNPAIKYDAGHMLSRGAFPELRFNLLNIHKQCSVRCNQHGSGMRKEYELFIVSKYGQDTLDELTSKHPTLKEQFPNVEDIEREKVKFRKMIKDIS